jgi:succinate dehydrogenase flavin-adding protein (antitoxin of CptAB toxin-antitoxin module)
MRELDVLLTRWLDAAYDDASDDRKAAFLRLLTLSDPELAGYLLSGLPPEDPELADVVRQIRGTDPS